MKSEKLEEESSPLISIDRQTLNHSHLKPDEEESYGWEAEREQGDHTLPIMSKTASTNSVKVGFLKQLMNCASLFTVFVICHALSAQYFDLNQICPYSTDFECYYRYLLCEGDCNPSRPLYKQGLDFIVESRKHEFLLSTRLAEIITKLLIISAIYAFILSFGLLKKGSRLFVVIVAINIVYLRIYRDGEAHGDYTKTIGTWLIFLVSRLSFIFTGIVLLARLNSKGKMYSWIAYGSIVVWTASIGFGLAHRFFNSCSHWDKGLYGESIDNTVNCQFSKPTFCLYEFFGDTYDYNRWLMMTCQDRKPHWGLMNQEYANVSRIGFPTLTGATKEDRMTQNVPNYVSANMKEVTEANEKDFEVVLHRTFDNKTGIFRDPAWIDINIQFNQALVAQRSQRVTSSIADNVLVIYIDSLSRAGAFRQLPETMKLFENIRPKVHQFFKYHSVTPTALGNLYPIFYGMNKPYNPDPLRNNMPSFIHEYKDKGFITGRALSSCATSAIDDLRNSEFIDEEPFDHIGNGWACDINAKGNGESTTGPLAMVRRCIYGKDLSEYVIDYGRKFWKTYQNHKKFLWLDFLDFHDSTFSQDKYLDVHLSKFLGEMDFSDTMLILVSDNGQNVFYQDLFRFFRSTEIEKAAPALFIKLPTSAETTYGENLEKNKQQIIQGFDINKMLKAIPNPNLASDTAFYPIETKAKNCDFPVQDQECNCILPRRKEFSLKEEQISDGSWNKI